MNAIIDKLDFGKESAESEHKFLDKVFLQTAVFQRIRNGERNLVLGRKGSGKTAVCLRLYKELEQKGSRVSLITPRDLSRFRVSLLEKGSLNSAESSLLSWKLVFFVELGSYILGEATAKYGANYLTWPENIRKVRGFLVENSSQHANWIDKTFNIIRGIKKIGIASFETEVDPSAISHQVVDFTEKLDDITDDLYSALTTLTIDSIEIMVDKVDELWEPGPESRRLVVGLLRASKELNDQSLPVKVTVFLRSDIYDSLQFHDSDKFHSSEERIIWDKFDLKSLIALRARASTGISTRRDATDKIWTTFFPDQVEGEESFEYLLTYTLMRPRDLIQLCKLCRDKAQNHRHSTITAGDIREALPQYSKWKLGDIRDEYVVQYPFLERVLLGLFQYAKPRLTTDDIAKRLDVVKPHLVKEYESFYFDPISNLLQILYNVGFLGAIHEGKTLYSSRGDNVVISYVQEFKIHPAFRPALDVQDNREAELRSSPVQIGPISNSIGDVVTTGSAVTIGGGVNVGNIGSRMEQEILSLVSNFNGQFVPGRLLNVDTDIVLPQFSRVIPNHEIGRAGVRIDIYAVSSTEKWIIEVKRRELQVSDLHQVASYSRVAEAKAWIVSYEPLTPQVRAIATNLGVLVTGIDELGVLRSLLRE
ncbi:MAG: hypothetical protein L0387_26480 [Acidobacteria bacterium]|nr:hypothetical protein [Acidobacteriota bacterium]